MSAFRFWEPYGFQWPCLIQALSQRKEGTPKLKITAIDIPRPGFNPAGQIEETGRRLHDYARSFGVHFEYNGILLDKWDSICIDDLNNEVK